MVSLLIYQVLICCLFFLKCLDFPSICCYRQCYLIAQFFIFLSPYWLFNFPVVGYDVDNFFFVIWSPFNIYQRSTFGKVYIQYHLSYTSRSTFWLCFYCLKLTCVAYFSSSLFVQQFFYFRISCSSYDGLNPYLSCSLPSLNLKHMTCECIVPFPLSYNFSVTLITSLISLSSPKYFHIFSLLK